MVTRTSSAAPQFPRTTSVAALASRLERVRASLIELEKAVDLRPFGAQQDSARNLLHYLAFRRFDLRRDQTRLAQWGLSSLGRSESHVLYNLDSVLGWLDWARGKPRRSRPPFSGVNPDRGRKILERNARALLGPTRPGRDVRIMVTMPSEAATDYGLVQDLLEGGMDCARINCAHDEPDAWARMITHIHRAERAVGRRCRIEMDLGGPKIRTGTIRPGPPVVKVRPKRDPYGRVTTPASLWLSRPGDPTPSPTDEPLVTVPPAWLRRRRLRERVAVVDARGARRTLRLVEKVGDRYRAEVARTTYLTTGTRLVGTTAKGGEDATSVGPVPPIFERIRLNVGDRLVLTSNGEPGENARRDALGRVRSPAQISCTYPEMLRLVRRGEAVWFDDGRIGGVVRSTDGNRLMVEVTHAPVGGTWLGPDKGINLPDTTLDLPPIPSKDRRVLDFIVRNADLVGYSFIHTAHDLDRLRRELTRLGRPRMGIILKVETRRGFEELPGILLASLRQPPVGVMIARGDLAVEVGYERLAEIQEEILWLSEAAHIPTIWATQVLEGLTKSGLPSRAEVTDAAMGERAECVMLNKGPRVVVAVRALDSILRRMQSHQAKKMAMLRHLNVVERFITTGTAAGRTSRGPRPRAGA